MIYVVGDCFVRDLVHTNPDLENNKKLILRGHPGQGPFKLKNFISILELIEESIQRKVILENYHQMKHKEIECLFFNVEKKCDHFNDYKKCKPYIDKLEKLTDTENSIIFWFGHADNRDARCTDLNRESFIKNDVELYIKYIKEYLGPYFKNFYIAEPFPIFINSGQLNSNNEFLLSKLKNERIFLKNLRMIAKQNDIEIIISQEEILEASGVDFFNDSLNVPEFYDDRYFMLPVNQQQKIMQLVYKKTLTL